MKKVTQKQSDHTLDEVMSVRKELNTSSREAAAFFIGVFLFFCGFLFNLTANIVYDLIKENPGWRIIILLITMLSLVFLIILIRKYVLVPIMEQKEKLEKLQRDVQ